MICLENLLNMICTESFESTPVGPRRKDALPKPDEPPPMRYDLELIEHEDGSLEWVED
jgi:hypothetical protein